MSPILLPQEAHSEVIKKEDQGPLSRRCGASNDSTYQEDLCNNIFHIMIKNTPIVNLLQCNSCYSNPKHQWSHDKDFFK